MGKRVEEGLAILVKSDLVKKLKNDTPEKNNNQNQLSHSLFVSKTQTLFLPRNFDDSRLLFLLFTSI